MFGPLRLSHVSAGLTAVVVGYSSAVVLVIEAAKAAGASPPMVVSWLFALGIGMGVSCIGFSLFYRLPVVTAWSTPGAAFLLGAAGDYALTDVIGAFVLAGGLSIVCAQSRRLTGLITRIPDSIAAALLAGIVLPICLAIFSNASAFPLTCAVFLVTYILGWRFFPRYMMLVLLLLAAACSWWLNPALAISVDQALATPVWVTPTFSLSAAIGLAVPLFVITMLSQNVPGMAILQAYQFAPNHKVVLTGLGGLQAGLGPLGGFAFNYAAITAALCMGEDAGSDRKQRYLASVVAGVAYIILGIFAGLVVSVFLLMPAVVVQLLAGLALLGTLQSALLNSMRQERYRGPALLTLVCSASGMSLFALGAPVWGLMLGLLMVGAEHLRRPA